MANFCSWEASVWQLREVIQQQRRCSLSKHVVAVLCCGEAVKAHPTGERCTKDAAMHRVLNTLMHYVWLTHDA